MNKIYDTPEQTDGYKGLYGEVVTCDTYRLKQLPFTPDVIFDLGANIGVFTRHARQVFPHALIIAVEPDATNFEHLVKFTPMDYAISFLNKAIGIGDVYFSQGVNGSGHCFLTSGLGYPSELMPKDDRLTAMKTQTIMLDELVKAYVAKGKKYIIKCDIEGNEHTLFTHHPSWQAIVNSDYFCAEIHKYAINGAHTEEVNRVTDETLKSLEKTHKCDWEHVHFYSLSNKYEYLLPIISPEIEAQ